MIFPSLPSDASQEWEKKKGKNNNICNDNWHTLTDNIGFSWEAKKGFPHVGWHSQEETHSETTTATEKQGASEEYNVLDMSL